MWKPSAESACVVVDSREQAMLESGDLDCAAKAELSIGKMPGSLALWL